MRTNDTYRKTVHRAGRRHLFLDFLSKQKKDGIKPDFATFYEYLRYLNTNVLDGYAEQLEYIEQARFPWRESDERFDYTPLKRYLCAIKADAFGFIQLLTQLIQ